MVCRDLVRRKQGGRHVVELRVMETGSGYDEPQSSEPMIPPPERLRRPVAVGKTRWADIIWADIIWAYISWVYISWADISWAYINLQYLLSLLFNLICNSPRF